uniref:Uncharacterized protein n=2 Tax=Oryza sativa subsp. japonica TaxID=39947 RepID=Q6AT42_ORYSJ|nr:hypothetical protein [Oryza sativa Japonica Group]
MRWKLEGGRRAPPLLAGWGSAQAAGHSPMGGEKGVGRWGKARRRRPPADMVPNDRERSRHGLAHVRGVARVPTTTAMSSSSARVRAGASASSRWPSSYPGLPPRHDGQAPIPQAHTRPHRAAQKPMCSGVPELRLSSAEANTRLRRIVFEVNSIYSTLRSQRPRCMRPFPQRLPPPSFLFAASLLPTYRRVSSSGFYLPPPPNNHHPSPCWSPATTHLSRDSASGVLFACMHGHSCSQWCSRVCSGIATYSISQLLEILLPIPTVWLTCDHDADVAQMRGELTCNDVVV